MIGGLGPQYRCHEGKWEGLAAKGLFNYTWWREPPRFSGIDSRIIRDGRPRLPDERVGSGPTYRLEPKDAGRGFYCQVTVRAASGRILTVNSASVVLSGLRSLPPAPLVSPIYGNVRIRGIDAYQTVQPFAGATMFGYPTRGFGPRCGGGTPTSYGGGLHLGARCFTDDATRARYDGVPIDESKPMTAVVYMDMAGVGTTDSKVLVTVTLRARLGGRQLLPALTREQRLPQRSTTPWVTLAERGDPQHGLAFEVPSLWLFLARVGGERLDLEASLDLTSPRPMPVRQCENHLLRDCLRDDRFTLERLPVASLPRLTVRSVALTRLNQTQASLRRPAEVLASAIRLFPGGDRLDIPDYAATEEIGDINGVQLSDAACAMFRDADGNPIGGGLRGCRWGIVQTALNGWYNGKKENREGYDVLMGVVRYAQEPGWKPGDPTIETPGATKPTFFADDGTLGLPITAAAHEFGHALGLPHADLTCGGPDGGNAEAWPDDNRGRLQGVASETTAPGPIHTPRVDTAERNLFDLMSYCPQPQPAVAEREAVHWLSARNWNRTFKALQQHEKSANAAVRTQKAEAGEAFASGYAKAEAGEAFAIGYAGPGGARIVRVIPADRGNLVPAPDAQSGLQLRALDAQGRTVSEIGARLERAADIPGASTFAVPVHSRATTIELVSQGTVVDRKTRSRAPSVRVTSPRRGTRAGDQLLVRWTAQDPDRDELHATVDFAADGGSRWRTVFAGPSTGRAAIPAPMLESTARGRVRVTVNDGFGQARAESATFTVQGRPPTAQIIQPRPAAGQQAGIRVVLEGSAVDDRRRPLRGRALTWYAGSRRLGAGERLTAALPAGRIALRLRATDARGRSSVVTQRVRVNPAVLRITSASAPARVPRGATRVAVTLATTVPATVRAGGRRYRVGPRARRILLSLPRSPRLGVLNVRFTIAAAARRRGAISETLLFLRA